MNLGPNILKRGVFFCLLCCHTTHMTEDGPKTDLHSVTRRRAQQMDNHADWHGRAGKPNCDAAPPLRSAACHYWVWSICGTQHRPRALLACYCYLLVVTYCCHLLHLLLQLTLRKPGSRSIGFGGHPGEGLPVSKKTLAGLIALWNTKAPCFTRGTNPLE